MIEYYVMDPAGQEISQDTVIHYNKNMKLFLLHKWGPQKPAVKVENCKLFLNTNT